MKGRFIMNNQLQQALIDLAIAVIPTVGAFICAFISKQMSHLENKIQNDNAKHYLDVAVNAVETSVQAVGQTYVDQLKKAGTFDAQAQKTAFEMAKAQVFNILGESGTTALRSSYGDIDTFIEATIEKFVKQQNKTV
jgi:TctA family transporter